MSFRCTACFDKSYDKDWKLQRHIRESRKCSEQLNPGISRTRFKCWSCDYTSPREDDLRRHRRRIHPDIAIATGTETEEAGQPMAGRYETSDVAPCLQPVNPLDVNERQTSNLIRIRLQSRLRQSSRGRLQTLMIWLQTTSVSALNRFLSTSTHSV